MKARLLLRRAAELDLEGIEDWYESQQPGLAAEFREAVDELLRRIVENPRAYPERYRGCRRAMMRRFPFMVWYRFEGEAATLLACVHGRRDPRVFRARLREGTQP